MTLPGWDASYTPDEMAGLIEKYKAIGEEGLWSNLEYFIKEIIPVAIECDVNIRVHLDATFLSVINNYEILDYEDVYYYNDEFYGIYRDFCDKEVIYKNVDKIMNDGVKLY